MKNSLRKRMRAEEGKVLVLVLAMLVVGGLVLAPLLGLGSTGLASGEVYERRAAELYAADAGVEDAIWKLQNPDVSELPHKECGDTPWTHSYSMPRVNDKTLSVTIDYLVGGLFKITSTATTDDGSSTTVLSYLEANYEGSEDGPVYDLVLEEGGQYDGTIKDQSVYSDGDLHVTENIEGGAVVYVVGDLTVDGNIEDHAQIYVTGDLVLTGTFRPGNIEDEVIVCVGGNLILEHCSENGVEIYVEGNLWAIGIENQPKICVEGTITVDKVEGQPTVCAGAGLDADEIEGGDIYAPPPHKPFPDCPMCCVDDCRICCECPLEFAGQGAGGGGEGAWGNWRVTTYLINP